MVLPGYGRLKRQPPRQSQRLEFCLFGPFPGIGRRPLSAIIKLMINYSPGTCGPGAAPAGIVACSGIARASRMVASLVTRKAAT